MAEVGMARSLVRRPYLLDDPPRAQEQIPLEATAQPQLFTNFITTPHDLALLMVSLDRGALGRGAVRRMGVDRFRARR
jgi:hypothetical protein